MVSSFFLFSSRFVQDYAPKSEESQVNKKLFTYFCQGKRLRNTHNPLKITHTFCIYRCIRIVRWIFCHLPILPSHWENVGFNHQRQFLMGIYYILFLAGAGPWDRNYWHQMTFCKYVALVSLLLPHVCTCHTTHEALMFLRVRHLSFLWPNIFPNMCIYLVYPPTGTTCAWEQRSESYSGCRYVIANFVMWSFILFWGKMHGKINCCKFYMIFLRVPRNVKGKLR